MLIPFYSGDLDAGEELLRPLRTFGPPSADLVQPKPYLAHQAMFDSGVPHHWGYYWKSHYLPPLSDGAIDVMLEHSWRKTAPTSYALVFHMGGAISRHAEDETAASGRDAMHTFNVNAA